MVLFLLLCSGARAAPVDPSPVLGVFTLAEDEDAAQKRLEQAIEASIADLSWTIRGMARSRMRDKLATCRQWTLEATATELGIACTGRGDALSIPLASGTTTVTRDQGDVVVSATSAADRLVVRYVGPNGTTVQTFRTVGDELVVESVSSSARLGKPLSHRVRYRRATPR